MTGYIKLYRQILEWEWYSDANTKLVFIHILLKANFKNMLWRGMSINRGQLFTSISHLSSEIGISEKQIRTSLKKLKSTKEIDIEGASNGTMITVCNYDTYQPSEDDNGEQTGKPRANEGQAMGKPRANEGRQRKNDKNDKNDKNTSLSEQNAPTPDSVEIIFDPISPIENLVSEQEKTGTNVPPPIAPPKPPKKVKVFSADSEEVKLSKFVLDEILKNKQDLKKPDLDHWARDMDLLLRVDKRTPEQVKELIIFAQADSFWKANILSVSSLRKQFDRLAIRKKENGNGRKTGENFASRRDLQTRIPTPTDYEREIGVQSDN